jgi:uncharacterized membrane protein
MNIALWIAQGILAAMFLMAGVMKSTQPREKLKAKLPWVEEVSDGTLKLIGVSELLGALGLILPWLTGIAPWLTCLAAAGLALVQVLAIFTHVRRKEPAAIVFNCVMIAGTLFVAWGRWMF